MKPKIESISSLSLKRKILISFLLISIIPFLTLVAYFSLGYVTPLTFIILSLIIAMGWWVIWEIFRSLDRVVTNTKKLGVVSGTYSGKDEVQFLEEALQKMSLKVKESLGRLQEISKSSEELNNLVARKAALISSVLQINDLLSGGAEVKEIIELSVKKVRDVLSKDVAFFLSEKGEGYFQLEGLDGFDFYPEVSLSKETRFLKPLVGDRQSLILDGNHSYRSDFKDFLQSNFKISSAVMVPVVVKREVIGILACGYKDSKEIFSDDDLESLEVFARHLALSLEHRKVSSKMDSFRDPLTGLYNRDFLISHLEEEIERAISHQRSCGFFLIRIVNCKEYLEKKGILLLEESLKRISGFIRENLKPGDKASRLGEGDFGLVLPERSRPQLEKEAEKFIKKLKNLVIKDYPGLQIGFGISENPVDGSRAEELIKKAEEKIDL